MTATRLPAPLVALVLLALALAGCSGGSDGDDAGSGDGGSMYASFEEAMAAPGAEFEAHPRGYDVHVKVLRPADLSNVRDERQDFVLLFWDARTDEPYEDLQVLVQSWHTEMGHAGNPGEVDPVHDAHGVYVGTISPSMPGQWEIQMGITMPDGIEAEVIVEPVTVK